jgi:hypothetical protein
LLFLFRLLTLPVTGPLEALRFILEQIRDQALAEMLTEEEIQSLLIDATMRYESGEISEEEFTEMEDQLLQELNTIRQLNQPSPGAFQATSENIDDQDDGDRTQ